VREAGERLVKQKLNSTWFNPAITFVALDSASQATLVVESKDVSICNGGLNELFVCSADRF
jgi:hypothetical protein